MVVAGEVAWTKPHGRLVGENLMSEAKKIAIGVLGGIAGIAALFAIVLMLAGKGDEPPARPQPLLTQVEPKPPAPAPVPPAPVIEQPKPLLAEQPSPPAPDTQATPATHATTATTEPASTPPATTRPDRAED